LHSYCFCCTATVSVAQLPFAASCASTSIKHEHIASCNRRYPRSHSYYITLLVPQVGWVRQLVLLLVRCWVEQWASSLLLKPLQRQAK
jgi:hypothetical protein